MIVLSEALDLHAPAAGRQDLQAATAIAQLLGLPVYAVPTEATWSDTALADVHRIQPAVKPTSAIWLGDRPTLAHYQSVYAAVEQRGLQLLNTPADYQTLRTTPSLVEAPPVALRYSRTLDDGTPLGRLFRVMVYRQHVISYGYVWHGDDPYRYLSVPDEEAMQAAALAVTKKLGIPFVAVDVGHTEEGPWLALGVQDPQFCDLSQMPLIHFWEELAERVRQEASAG